MASEEIKNTQKATKPKSMANKQATKKADESTALKKEIEELKEQLKSQMDLILLDRHAAEQFLFAVQ